jgi:hypothetical protein
MNKNMQELIRLSKLETIRTTPSFLISQDLLDKTLVEFVVTECASIVNEEDCAKLLNHFGI